jgi:hypothetical protein
MSYNVSAGSETCLGLLLARLGVFLARLGGAKTLQDGRFGGAKTLQDGSKTPPGRFQEDPKPCQTEEAIKEQTKASESNRSRTKA